MMKAEIRIWGDEESAYIYIYSSLDGQRGQGLVVLESQNHSCIVSEACCGFRSPEYKRILMPGYGVSVRRSHW